MNMQASAQSTERRTPEQVLHRLDWEVLRRLDGILQGDYRSLFMGGGLDFADLREYQPPDDVRHIDWNVTARMDLPYVRQFMEDREVTAWFLLDLSPSMAFGALDRQKESVTVDFVGMLARLLTRNGNRVGSHPVRQQRGVRDSSPGRQAPGAAADQRRTEASVLPRRVDDGPVSVVAPRIQQHQEAVAGLPGIGFYLPARLGKDHGPAQPQARAPGSAPLGPQGG